jgi:pyridinium-3,5-bisthiocarboxylic acid mononucleotide nickel chelatase
VKAAGEGTVCYVDMVGGAAGDMLVAAFLDAGVDRDALERALRTVVADGWTLAPRRVVKRGIAATYAGLVVPGEDGDDQHHHYPKAAPHRHGDEGSADHHHADGHAHDDHDHEAVGTRHLADVLAIVERSGLTARQRERASAIYRRLAEAEARVHGTTADAIHFHEIGQLDAILDVAASCVALDLLGIEELRCSPFPIGNGSIRMQHGLYPNPPPATAELMRGWPTRSVDVDGELVTTTAAAILTTLATPGPRPDLVIERIGYGAGRSDFTVPNVTRVMIGTVARSARAHANGLPEADRAPAASDTADAGGAPEGDDVVVIEANIDDMSPQHYELALERLFAAGARDVWLTPIHMKKGRPAITVSALAAPADERAVANTMLAETTTIGVRVRSERRYVLPRTIELVDTPYGPVRVKRAELGGRTRVQPEYDDLVRIARERTLALSEVTRVVQTCAEETVPT